MTFLLAQPLCVVSLPVPDYVVLIFSLQSSVIHKTTTPNQAARIWPTGRVLYSLKLTATVACLMSLHNFPMDTETCSVRSMVVHLFLLTSSNRCWLNHSKVYRVLLTTLKNWSSCGTLRTSTRRNERTKMHSSWIYRLLTTCPSSKSLTTATTSRLHASCWMRRVWVNLKVMHWVYHMTSRHWRDTLRVSVSGVLVQKGTCVNKLFRVNYSVFIVISSSPFDW